MKLTTKQNFDSFPTEIFVSVKDVFSGRKNKVKTEIKKAIIETAKAKCLLDSFELSFCWKVVDEDGVCQYYQESIKI